METGGGGEKKKRESTDKARAREVAMAETRAAPFNPLSCLNGEGCA